MLKRISFALLMFFMVIALLIKLAGFNSIDELFGVGETEYSFYYSFLQKVLGNVAVNPIKIPNIPTIPALSNIGAGGFIEILASILNAIIIFFNSIITILNVVVSLFNIFIQLFIMLVSFFQTLFDYFQIKIITFGA